MKSFSKYVALTALITICLFLNSCGVTGSAVKDKTMDTTIVNGSEEEVNSNNCQISRDERPVYNVETGKWFCDKKGNDNY